MKFLYKWLVPVFCFSLPNLTWMAIIWVTEAKLRLHDYSVNLFNWHLQFGNSFELKAFVAAVGMFVSFLTTLAILTGYEKSINLANAWTGTLVSLGISILSSGIAIKIFMGEMPSTRTIIGAIILVVAAIVVGGGK